MAREKIQDSGKVWPQILTIIIACIPGITSALLFSWPSPFLLVLINDKEHYNISEEEAKLVPVFLPVGMVVSSIFFYKIHDVIGRKGTLLLLCPVQSAFWIATIVSKDVYGFYIARFIAGVGDAIMYSALPIYVGEVTIAGVRGTWGNGQTFSFNAGFVIINVLGLYFTIQQTAYICLTLPILFAALFPWMPESPYYYLMKGQDERARSCLQWLRRKDNIEPDFLQLKADVERQISETGTWLDLYKITSNRKALWASLCLRLVQQSAGIVVFETYIQYIFDKSASGVFTPQVSSIIFSGLLFVIMGMFNLVHDKIGRRRCFICSSLGCAIVLLAECVYFYVDEFQADVDLTNLQWFPLAGMSVYVIVYSAGLGPLPSLMAGELFSASIKGKALAVTNVTIGLLLTASTYMFQALTTSLGLFAPFFIFSVLTFFGCILSFYIIPETQGRTLEEIQQEFKGNEKVATT